jgi:hypothetical protein
MTLAASAVAKSWTVSYAENFQTHDNSDDLGSALKYLQAVVDGMPDGHPDLADYQLNLVVLYKKHFEILGNVDDLESALNTCRQLLMQHPLVILILLVVYKAWQCITEIAFKGWAIWMTLSLL